ncbi:MAG: hypothetical protein K0R66_495 [Gammaproteobacteria bacterium]|jgi:hypothetical protein|nr:hypothetical protein [Gammaproteobacteria bacterium]
MMRGNNSTLSGSTGAAGGSASSDRPTTAIASVTPLRKQKILIIDRYDNCGFLCALGGNWERHDVDDYHNTIDFKKALVRLDDDTEFEIELWQADARDRFGFIRENAYRNRHDLILLLPGVESLYRKEECIGWVQKMVREIENSLGYKPIAKPHIIIIATYKDSVCLGSQAVKADSPDGAEVIKQGLKQLSYSIDGYRELVGFHNQAVNIESKDSIMQAMHEFIKLIARQRLALAEGEQRGAIAAAVAPAPSLFQSLFGRRGSQLERPATSTTSIPTTEPSL